MSLSSLSLTTLYQHLKAKKEVLDASSPVHSNWVSILLVYWAVIAFVGLILKIYYDIFTEETSVAVALLSGLFFTSVAIGCYHTFTRIKDNVLFVKVALHACMILGQGFLFYWYGIF